MKELIELAMFAGLLTLASVSANQKPIIIENKTIIDTLRANEIRTDSLIKDTQLKTLEILIEKK